jgi:hypothetical protein
MAMQKVEHGLRSKIGGSAKVVNVKVAVIWLDGGAACFPLAM